MDQNKDYILNIRVSRETYDKLRSRAKENRESLSSLVRKAVRDGLEIFSDIKRDFSANKNPGSKTEVSGIEHFQSVILAKDISCQRCNTALNKGERAFVGEMENGSKKYFCSNCFAGM